MMLGEMLNNMFPDAPDWVPTVMLWVISVLMIVFVVFVGFLVVNLFI